jgi:molecular chaperone GrpE
VSSDDPKAGSTASLKEKLTDKGAESDEEGVEQEQEIEMLDHESYVQLQKELTKAEEKASQYWDRMLRMQADTENMQRRAERDIANAHKYGLEKFLSELMPIIDNLERALAAHADDDSSKGSLLDGVSLTLKMLQPALEKFGVQQINPEGQPFNPEHHQAVSAQIVSGVQPGMVLNVLQKGYLLNNRLIRPAMVVVSK